MKAARFIFVLCLILMGSIPSHIDVSAAEQWRLPFRAGAQLGLDQAYFGTFSHNGKHALDIQGAGVEIAATKSGIIHSMNLGGKWNQWCNSWWDCYYKGGVWSGNHIVLHHPVDDTYSYYLHMEPNTTPTNFYIGAPVFQGQKLGLIGYTGYTCKDVPNCTIPDPHVHFEVRQNGSTIATPFEDCTYMRNACVNEVPIAFRTYTSINTSPYHVISTASSRLRLNTEEAFLSLQQNVRGSEITLTRRVDEYTQWEYSAADKKIFGPQNWCITAENYQISSKVFTWDCNDSINQKWVEHKSGTWNLESTNLCLYVNNEGGTPVLGLFTCSSRTDLQEWV